MERAAAMTDMYDQALLGILQHVGNVQEFLNILFGFLYRKTDFYRLLLQPEDRLGFPPGVAKSMTLRAFKNFEHLARKDDDRREQELQEKMKKKEEDVTAAGEKVPAVAEEVEINAAVENESASEGEKAAEPQEPVLVEEKVEDTNAAVEPSVAVPAPLETQSAELPRKQELFQSNPDSYNGAVRENYSWSQDYSDLEIKVPVPKHILKGRQVSVNIASTSIHVAVVEESGQRVLMEGTFTHRINTENSVWSLEPGKCLLINLSKVGEYWWSAVLEGEEQIDIDKINKERSMATVDEEEHAVLDRLSFDYHQKLQGKPQSHEMKVHEMLKKGWDAEGSPFRGQKFDPSMFNISPGAVHF
ncbi:nudC domain-containing protein 3 [Rhineura floridana]|uniref:nudC domain-containing protein 3 n=1 Tax=Rhineura floridana TaxID=261503 RepID=UPI002AC7FB35|nr:nudC domain-containing protein 3 [Rhineura floridana]